jgi:RNA polymerase sigma factor (sigma-70 family)
MFAGVDRLPGVGARRELARMTEGDAVDVAAGAHARPPLPPEVWAHWIRLYQRRVVLALVAAGFDFGLAEEMTNEAWTRLMDQDRRGRLAQVKLPGLAIAQARFLALDERRRHRALVAADGTASESDGGDRTALVDHRPDPEQRLLSRQQAGRAVAAIAAAPASAQRLFRLLYAEPGLPHAQAAEALGLSVQRVRQLLCELRKAVRAAIEGERP